MSWEKRSLLVGALVVGLAAAKASADTVELAFQNTFPSQIESISTNSGIGGFNQENAGQFNFNAQNQVGANAFIAVPTSTVATWCVELAQNVNGNPTIFDTYTVLGPGSFVAPLTNAQGTLLTAFFNQFFALVNNTDTATAFQLDIWELLFENTIVAPRSLGTGNFLVQSNDTAVQLGNSWLTSFNSATSGPWQLFQLHSDTLQDQIVPVLGGGQGNSTPLPPAWSGALLLMGAALGISKLRRKAAV